MTDIEKAKAYDEALEQAKKELNACGSIDCDAARQIFRFFPELRESEDEMHRKWILEYLYDGLQKADEQFKDRFKSAIDWLEKQKEQDKCPEYCVRSHCIGCPIYEKQKEQKDYNKLYEDIAKSEWFKKTYEGKSLGGNNEQRIEECEYDKETITQKTYREGKSAGRQEVFDNPEVYGLEKIDNVFGFRIGDKVKLKDGDGRPHIIKRFEKIEGLHGPDFYRVIFEDNTASDNIIPGDKYPNGYYTQMEKFEEEQKPANGIDMDISLTTNDEQSKLKAIGKFVFPKLLYARTLDNKTIDVSYGPQDMTAIEYVRNDAIEQKPLEWTELTWKDINELEDIINKVHYEFRNGIGQESFGKEVLEQFREYKGDEYLDEIEQKPTEWSEEDKDYYDTIVRKLEVIGDDSGLSNNQIKFLREHCPSHHSEWSEEDEECRKELIQYIEQRIGDGTTGQFLWKKWHSWLCSFPLNIKKRNEDMEKLCSNEWSEEDEKMVRFYEADYNNQIGDMSMKDVIDMRLEFKNWLINRLKDLRSHWKPSEQEKGALRTAIHVLTEERNFPKTAAQLQNILDAFEGKESRKDWKPSEEQMEMLAMFANLRCASRREANILESLYDQLKKL